jgi:hypothetical protein
MTRRPRAWPYYRLASRLTTGQISSPPPSTQLVQESISATSKYTVDLRQRGSSQANYLQ